MLRPRRRLIFLALVLAGVAFARMLTAAPAGPRSLKVFDPDRVAALELDMWQAYRYSWMRSAQASFYLARAAATFGDARADYERVLPDLECAYSIEKNWLGAGFDPAAVARAELAWWVARRIPGQNSPEQVGDLIAEENALLYEVPKARVLEASVLRARAGRLRDDGGEGADWPAVSALLGAVVPRAPRGRTMTR